LTRPLCVGIARGGEQRIAAASIPARFEIEPNNRLEARPIERGRHVLRGGLMSAQALGTQVPAALKHFEPLIGNLTSRKLPDVFGLTH
jgi:hypothetical protein